MKNLPVSIQNKIFKTKPFKHQLEALQRLIQSDGRFALFMEMGTGKTKVAIDWLNYRYIIDNKRDTVLWVAPNSILENEAEEFSKHSKLDGLSITFRLLRGSKNDKIRQIELSREHRGTSMEVLVVNYESVRVLKDELLSLHPDIIILDESTRIKNARAQQSKAMHTLGYICSNKLLMTGTPITQSPVDIYSQYKFLKPQLFGTSFLGFRARYCIMGGFQNRQIINYSNLDELSKRVYSCAYRVTKDECLDLPAKMYEAYKYDLSDSQIKVYKELKDNLVAEVKQGKMTASIAIVRLLRFRQICSGFFQIDDKSSINSFKENPKLELLKDIINDNDISKLIVWCNYIAEIKQLQSEFSKALWNTYMLYGETPVKTRQQLVNAFNKDKRENTILIGQIRTGGLGINLTGCNVAVYYGNTHSLEDRLQSEDRCHRIGQLKRVTYIDLIGRKTVEESIVYCLKNKKKLADIVINNMENILEGNL